jgi:Transposase IS116/IS110/IS902 family
VLGEFLAENRKHKAVKVLRHILCIGPVRAGLMLALMQTPQRFRSKGQLWTYSGLGVETHDSAQHRYVDGRLQRSKKLQQIRGLNQDHNHEMKKIFKSTATSASRCAGPFHDFYNLRNQCAVLIPSLTWLRQQGIMLLSGYPYAAIAACAIASIIFTTAAPKRFLQSTASPPLLDTGNENWLPRPNKPAAWTSRGRSWKTP